jgi:hypothetical protein
LNTLLLQVVAVALQLAHLLITEVALAVLVVFLLLQVIQLHQVLQSL